MLSTSLERKKMVTGLSCHWNWKPLLFAFFALSIKCEVVSNSFTRTRDETQNETF